MHLNSTTVNTFSFLRLSLRFGFICSEMNKTEKKKREMKCTSGYNSWQWLLWKRLVWIYSGPFHTNPSFKVVMYCLIAQCLVRSGGDGSGVVRRGVAGAGWGGCGGVIIMDVSMPSCTPCVLTADCFFTFSCETKCFFLPINNYKYVHTHVSESHLP